MDTNESRAEVKPIEGDPGTDTITVLVCHDSIIATKRWVSSEGGPLCLGYASARHFACHIRPVLGLDDLGEKLVALSSTHRAFVVRGAPLPDADRRWMRRLIHRGSDGAPPTIRDIDHRWMMVDIDHAVVNLPCAPCAAELDLVARALRQRLPAAFHDVRCVVQWGSSCGMGGWAEVSAHLWFWLDRPVCSGSLRRWLTGSCVDVAVCNAAQAHYTAAPIFEGVADPFEGMPRVSMVEGAGAVVSPPQAVGDHESHRVTLAREAAASLKRAEASLRRRRIEGGGDDVDSEQRAARMKLRLIAQDLDEVSPGDAGARHREVARHIHRAHALLCFLPAAEIRDALRPRALAIITAARGKRGEAEVDRLFEGSAQKVQGDPACIGKLGQREDMTTRRGRKRDRR